MELRYTERAFDLANGETPNWRYLLFAELLRTNLHDLLQPISKASGQEAPDALAFFDEHWRPGLSEIQLACDELNTAFEWLGHDGTLSVPDDADRVCELVGKTLHHFTQVQSRCLRIMATRTRGFVMPLQIAFLTSYRQLLLGIELLPSHLESAVCSTTLDARSFPFLSTISFDAIAEEMERCLASKGCGRNSPDR